MASSYSQYYDGNLDNNGNGHNDSTGYNDSDYYGYDYTYEYEQFPMQAFKFEQPLNIFILFLVFLTSFFNIVIMSVLLRRSMRIPTNIIFVAIAVADSLSGLVMVPTYIYIYSTPHKGYHVLTKGWCNFFMMSKFFLSRYFHTVSIWLTLFLGFQRFVCVIFPFKAKDFFTMIKTMIAIGALFLLAPILHLYHLLDEKTDYGMCSWSIEQPCVKTCVYFWLEVLLMHMGPGIMLIIFTSYMLKGLTKSRRKTSQPNTLLDSKNLDATSKAKNSENRRLSLIVVTLVIVFLIPEVPYGLYLLIFTCYQHAGKKLMTLETNRILHNVYEVLLLLSFHANFWIYTVMNKRFRSALADYIKPLKKFIRRTTGGEVSVTQPGSSTEGRTFDSELNSTMATEMKPVQNN